MSEGTTRQATTPPPPNSEKFTALVIREFSANVGAMSMSPMQKKLAQHLYIKVDHALKELETKRLDKGESNKLPITWENVNLPKLAIDAVHRIELGLDALCPNHIHVIPYFNGRSKRYDIDLRIGYAGKDYYRRALSADPPVEVIYELVYETDLFVPIKRTMDQVETYRFEIKNPFNRGEIVGGFGYIMFDDARKNRLVIITNKDFERSKTAAKSEDFWKKNPTEMRFKTIVHRVTDHLRIDPEKVTGAFLAVESQDLEPTPTEASVNANVGPVIDIKPEPPKPEKPEESQKPRKEQTAPEPEKAAESKAQATGPDF